MPIREWFRRRAGVSPDAPNPIGEHDEYDAERRLRDQTAIIAYWRMVSEGGQRDEDFERASLSQRRLIAYDVAEILFAVASEMSVPVERVADFMEIGIDGHEDNVISTLLRRIEALAEAFGPLDRCKFICSGTVGEARELVPLRPELDNAGTVVKLCNVVAALRAQEGHGAVDVSSMTIQSDDGWPV